MALKPNNSQHALQIQAGTKGRRRGHDFEAELAQSVNSLTNIIKYTPNNPNVFKGQPEKILVQKALHILNWDKCDHVDAIALGSLATAEEGKKWLKVNGVKVKACKSDILLTLKNNKKLETIGVSVKQCNTASPTNAQLFFTTATAFCALLNRNNLVISNKGLNALKQFCGDEGFRPMDDIQIKNRTTDPRRFFWEEIDHAGRIELENLFSTKQNEITKLLLQKAYLNDPFTPELLIHKTKKLMVGPQEYALYSIDELVNLSKSYSGFTKKIYNVKKGQYKDPKGIEHEAPRFGIVQMQRGGQKQHPTQLQFNLQAGYFYKI